MSASISCPFCGEIMDSPLRFCVACGRAISAEDIKRAGLRMGQNKQRGEGGGRPDIARKDYTFQRQMRAFFLSVSTVLFILIGYYVVMKYFLHEHMPGNVDVLVEQMVSGQAPGADQPASLRTSGSHSSRP